jgi:hypothetical protein
MNIPPCWRGVPVVFGLLAGAFFWPAPTGAQLLGDVTQTIDDAASTITQTVTATTGSLLGATATLADAGTLAAGTNEALQASDLTAGIPSLLSAEALHATAIGYSDQIDSEASLVALDLTLPGTSIGADFVMARATAANASGTSGISNIDRLTIDGEPVWVSGAPNQTISIVGGVLVLNEQVTLPDGTMVVNALHATVDDVADVVVASATAGWSGGGAKAVQASY